MQVTIISQEKGSAKVQVTFPGEVLSKALDKVYAEYTKNHADFQVPRADIATDSSAQNLLRQAVQDVFSAHYAQAIAETGLTVASEPVISVHQASETEGLEFQMEFALRPEVKLGQYKGIHVKCPVVELTVEEKQAAIDAAAAQNTVHKSVDRPAQLGDIAVIDFTGYLDGVPFDGGAGTDYPLPLGSGTFIPGFEEQLVGASVGDQVAVNVTFPENYQAANLAGKPTVFQVTIKGLQHPELAPLTDEQKEQAVQQAQKQKKNRADMQIEDYVLGKILDEANVEIPDAMLKSEVNICMQQFAAELSAKGGDLNSFAQQSGKTIDQLAAEMVPLAKRRIMLRLVLSAIAEAEHLEATAEEVEAQWNAMAQQYGIDTPHLKEYAGDGAEAQIKAEITSSKAYALLRESTILEME
jgi:trigger factor